MPPGCPSPPPNPYPRAAFPSARREGGPYGEADPRRPGAVARSLTEPLRSHSRNSVLRASRAAPSRAPPSGKGRPRPFGPRSRSAPRRRAGCGCRRRCARPGTARHPRAWRRCPRPADRRRSRPRAPPPPDRRRGPRSAGARPGPAPPAASARPGRCPAVHDAAASSSMRGAVPRPANLRRMNRKPRRSRSRQWWLRWMPRGSRTRWTTRASGTYLSRNRPRATSLSSLSTCGLPDTAAIARASERVTAASRHSPGSSRPASRVGSQRRTSVWRRRSARIQLGPSRGPRPRSGGGPRPSTGTPASARRTRRACRPRTIPGPRPARPRSRPPQLPPSRMSRMVLPLWPRPMT